jgi:hypothetical protein
MGLFGIDVYFRWLGVRKLGPLRSQSNSWAEGVWASLYATTHLILTQVWNWVQGVGFGPRRKLERSQLSDEKSTWVMSGRHIEILMPIYVRYAKKWKRTSETL